MLTSKKSVGICLRLCLVTVGVVLLVAGCSGGDDDSPTAPTRVGPAWSQLGSGNSVFSKPNDVRRVRITGTFPGTSSNFIVWCGSNLLVNVIIGTSSLASGVRYEGTHAAESCTEVRIENSNGVTWTIVEVR